MPATDASRSWVDRLAACSPPVLRATAHAVAAWARRCEEADARALGELALADPLLCVRILAAATRRVAGTGARPARSVTGALVLLGIEPFFTDMQGVPVLEDALAREPGALAGALRELARAHRSARLAAAFAIHRQDENVEELQLAALLHRFGALLLPHAAPDAARAIRQLRARGHAAPDAQCEVLGAPLAVLSAAVLRHWGVPEALCELAYASPPRSAGERTVAVAVRMADHLESGWSHPGLAADVAEAGVLLNLQPRGVALLVQPLA